MDENIKLSEYADNLIKEYNNNYLENCSKVIEYLNKVIDKDLYLIGRYNNPINLYNNLYGWLLKFYPNELKDSYELNGFDYDTFKKSLIFCFIITFFRNKENSHILYGLLKENNIISRFLSNDDKKYELYTTDYGIIPFYDVNKYYSDDKAISGKIKQMGKRLIDGCHEISEFMIKNNKSLYALTGILTEPLDDKIFHSVVLDKDMIIDIPNGVIMSYEDYFKLSDFEIISKYNYEELVIEDKEYQKYDESKTLFPLLRCMLYKMYIDSKKDRKK